MGVFLSADFGGAFASDLILFRIPAIPPSAPIGFGTGAPVVVCGLEIIDGICGGGIDFVGMVTFLVWTCGVRFVACGGG